MAKTPSLKASIRAVSLVCVRESGVICRSCQSRLGVEPGAVGLGVAEHDGVVRGGSPVTD